MNKNRGVKIKSLFFKFRLFYILLATVIGAVVSLIIFQQDSSGIIIFREFICWFFVIVLFFCLLDLLLNLFFKKNKKFLLCFRFIYFLLAIIVGISMIYIAVRHNPQGSICSYESSSCDIGYLFTIFLSWFVVVILPFICLDLIFFLVKKGLKMIK